MKLISPSKFAMNACGFKPTGLPALTDGQCMMCGFHHEKGDLIVDAPMSESFTNYSSLAAPSSAIICGYCATAGNDVWTRAWMQSVITSDGAFTFSSNNDIAYWLLNPPSTPFIMIKGDQKKQHLLWRTPVNLSREIYQIRLGEKMITIRLKHLIAAKEASLSLSPLLVAYADRAKKSKSSKTLMPFIRPSREMKDYLGGQLRYDAYVLARENTEAAIYVDTINRCTPGEIWALTAVLYAKPIAGPTKQVFKDAKSVSKASGE